MRAAAQGVNLPDILEILGEKRDFASFIKAGHILDLTSYMTKDNSSWQNSFFPKALEVNIFTPDNSYAVKPGVYGVPIDIMTIQMVYNKKLGLSLGFPKPPVNMSNLLEIARKAKDAKLEGLVCGWGELWLIDCFASNYAFNIMGKDKVLETIRGNVPYTDPDWIAVLDIFRQMRQAGLLSTSLVTMVNKTAEQLFANEKAVLAFNGSWCVNVYKGMNPNLEYVGILPPKASDKYPMAIWGGAGSSFMVNARSKQKEEAVKFLRWLTEVRQQTYLSEATNNLPANKNCVNKIPEVLSSFAKAMDHATHPNAWGLSESSQVIEAWDKGIQSIIIGEKTPAQVAEEVQKLKVRELAKRH